MARLVAQKLNTTYGTVIVENRPGGGSTIGLKAVATAEPDGYTFLFGGTMTLSVIPPLYRGAEAELFVNLSGGSWCWRDEYARIPHKVFIDSDPAFTQLAIAKAEPWYVAFFERFDRLFTFGANIGTPASPIPVGDFAWHKTWQPITLDRADHLSFYFCSGYDIATSSGRQVDDDIADVGCA